MTAIQKLRKIQKSGELGKCFQGQNLTSVGWLTIKSQSNGVVIRFDGKCYTYVNGKISRLYGLNWI